MAFQLPKLTGAIDCGPIGYPGLRFEVWLNATADPYEPPEVQHEWDTPYWYQVGAILTRCIIPAEYSSTGVEETIELPDGKAVYDLAQLPGIDHRIIPWVIRYYGDHNLELRQDAAKN